MKPNPWGDSRTALVALRELARLIEIEQRAVAQAEAQVQINIATFDPIRSATQTGKN